MQRTSDEFLARSAFTVNHDGRVGRCDLTDLMKDILHGRTIADDVGDFTGVGQLTAKLSVFPLQLIVFASLSDLLSNEIQVQWLCDKIKSTGTHSIDSGFHG